MRPETISEPECERAISTEAAAFRKRVAVRDTTWRTWTSVKRTRGTVSVGSGCATHDSTQGGPR